MYTKQIDNTDVTTWELPEGAIGRLGQGWLLDVEFSPDGLYLTVATQIGFWIYDTATLTPQALWGTERGMINVATFSDDARWIATGDQDGIVKVWDTQNGQCVTKIDWRSTGWRNSVLHVHFSPDGQHLAASGFGHSAVYDWRTNNEVPIASFTIENPKLEDYSKEDAHYEKYFPVSFSPSGNLFAYVSSPGIVTISDIDTGEHIANLTGHNTPVHSLLFSPCGQYLAGANLGATVQAWNIQNESLEMMPTTYEGNRVRLVYTPDGTLQVADLHENKVVIWDAPQQKKLGSFDISGIAGDSARFSNDGTQFAVSNTQGDIQVWKEGTPSTVASFSGYKSAAYSVVFIQEGRTLVSSHWGRRSKVFWNVTTGEHIHTFWGHASDVQDLTFSPDGTLLASGSFDGSILLWNMKPFIT